MRKLSTGEQDFSQIYTNDQIYVDKTNFIYNIITASNKFFFLSRPRRFGKSLLISTLKHIFLGNKQYFEGLFIEDKIEWKAYPILHFDFSSMSVGEFGTQKAIQNRLSQIAEEQQITINSDGIGTQFRELIVKLHQKTGQQVVILIDEYDKPINECIEKEIDATPARDVMKAFYSIVKGSSEHIKFFFLTGITRFSRVSIFSDLNNLTDLTFDKKYNNLCGYTKEELEVYFTAHFEALAKDNKLTLHQTFEKTKLWYNGYSWDGVNRVYNPFSISRLLDSKSFENYWFETGTPRLLITRLKKVFRYELKDTPMDMASFNNFDINNLNLDTLLFQTGYLTVKERYEDDIFILSYPNKEVEQSLFRYLLMSYSENFQASAISTNLIRAVRENNLPFFIETINVLFAAIPNHIFIEKREAYYHSIIYIALKICGFYIESEINQSKGRLDARLRFENSVYIFEFKLDASVGEAMQQIDQRQYAKPYLHQGLDIYLVGINFSSRFKEVEGWQVQKV